MNIKVQCNCGAKFAFDVEPVNGQMPCTIACPQCGVDATAAANQTIAQNLSAVPTAVAIPAQPPRSAGLRVAAVAAPAHAASAPVASAPAATTAGQMCTRHPRKPVQSHCYVCGKSICMDCMQIFGYLCSATCRYQAEQQGIQVPTCEYKNSEVDARDWSKIGAIIAGILVVIAVLIGGWAWFVFVGSHPKAFYTLKAGKENWYTHAQFIDPQHIIVTDDKQVALHDIDAKKVVWATPYGKDVTAGAFDKPKLVINPNDVWVCVDSSVLRLDRKNGNVLNTIPLKAAPSDIRVENGELILAANPDGLKEIVTHIDLATANVKTDEQVLTQIPKTVKKRDFSQADPTEGVLLNQELESPMVTGKEGSQLIPAGENIVEMQVRMVEEHFTEVQSIKPNKGPSKLDGDVSAASPAAPIAEELFNDIARSRGGGYKTIDESRYNVTLRRSNKEIPDWRGDVTGPPFFYALKTIDVLTAGTGVWIFDKHNKLLKQEKLAHPIAQQFAFGFSKGAPCLEVDGVLYFHDSGVITAFEVPGGDVRWRLPSVGVSNMQSDGKGALYVCTTSASPEDIQYTDQITIQDRAKPVLMKVDAKSGKILWKVDHLGVGCYLTGKFVYGSNVSVSSGPSLAMGLAQALGSPTGGSARFRLSRVDPDSGKEIWGYYQEGNPQTLDFDKNRILIQYDDRVVLLKFLSL